MIRRTRHVPLPFSLEIASSPAQSRDAFLDSNPERLSLAIEQALWYVKEMLTFPRLV